MKYVVGTSDAERSRLELQAKLVDPYALRVLLAAGLAPGRSILDIGTGAGDVALLAAAQVGPSGRVVGIDIEPDMIAHARGRATEQGLTHVSFAATSALLDEIDERFDVVFARLVLLFQPDQQRFLVRAARLVRPGGSLAIIDTGWNVPAFWSSPALPDYDRHMDQLIATLDALGVDTGVGSRLVTLFAAAGLTEPQMSAELLTGGKRSGIVDHNLALAEVIFAQARAAGLACPSLDEQRVRHAAIQRAVAQTDTQFFGPCLIGAVLQL